MAPNEKLKIQSFLLIPLLFSIFGHALNADAADLVTSTQHLKDGETVRTEDGSFKLGFFSPANSNDRYVGIWFATIPQQTVVWVANRENPVKNSSGVFRIGKDGNLVVLDGHDNILWSSNVSTASNNSVGELLDNGNLILRSGDLADTGNFLWQSFDHPSDTFLPGMKFGMNLKTNQSQLLKAWKNADNPSAGEFSLGFDPDGTAQIIIWNGTKRHYRSGQWNGQRFGGIPDMTSYHYYGFTVVSDKDEGRLYCIYSNPNKTVLSSFVLNPYGKLDRMYLFDRTSSWKLAWSGPNSECETYGTCGSNGVCNENRSPLCGCLKGFAPSSPQDWKAGNWSGGCVRQKPLSCNEDGTSRNDGFLKISGVKLPDFARPVALEGQENCTEICKKKCSCIAFSYEIGLGCLTWHGDLEDLQMFEVGGQDLYLRLDKSYLRGMHKVKMAIGILAILLGVILMVFSTMFMCRRIARNKGKEGGNKKLQFLDVEKKIMNSDRQYDHLDGIELEVGVTNANSPEVPLFSLDFVRFATDDFSMANKLGEGGFGPVYKGKLPNGQEIAVKRLSKVSGQGLQEFRNEVILIAKLQHRNLVRLLGYCIQGEEKLLIYEYMPNKSLDAFLFDPIKKAELDWRKRFDIIEGIARGLLYLHRDSRLRIIHRDLKASNILLDEEMNPKISDFGTARIFGGKDHQENTVRVVGTYGYMAPEYAMEGLLSLKSDVFSFGVLLLEIVSGKRNANFYHPEKPMNLLGYAWELWQEDKMLQFVDPSLGESYLGDQVSRCIQVGFLCVQDNTTDRPTMDSAVFMLGSEATVLPTPKKPSFSLGRTPRETDEQGFSSGNCSANAVTMTKLLGR